MELVFMGLAFVGTAGIVLLLVRSIEIQRLKLRDLQRHLDTALKDKSELFTALRNMELDKVDRQIEAAMYVDNNFKERRALQMRKDEKK